MSVVVALSGSIGSGKSHLARALAGRLGCPTAAFGALVRREAAARDLPATRAALQDLGERLLADLGPLEFTRRLLVGSDWSPGDPLVVDGVRHLRVLDALRALVAPTPLRHLHVEAPEAVRRARRAARGEDPGEDPERHRNEAEVDEGLRARADRVVDGSADTDDTLGLVLGSPPASG